METATNPTQTSNNQQQGSHFYVMTVQKALHTGATADYTLSGHLNPPANWTRADFYTAIYQDIIRVHPQLAGASVLFFTVDRNQI
jgi:hypothetical protein